MGSFHAVLALLVAAACDCGAKVQKIDPAVGPMEEALDFGLVAVGDTAVLSLSVSAVTAAELTLAARVEDDGRAFALDATPPALIAGDGSVEVAVRFSPPAVDTYAGTLVITTSDPDPAKATHRVVLSGSGKSPQIAVVPGQLSLDAIACPATARSERCTDQKSVTVENVGEVRLRLDKVEVVPDAAGGRVPAGLALAKLVSTTALEPGEKLEVAVRWKPAVADVPGPEARDFAAKLVVPSNDPAKPRVEVPIAARAQPNQPPAACAQVAKVTKRVYRRNEATGEVTQTTACVPPADYGCAAVPGDACLAAACAPAEAAVRPGMTVTLVAGDACTSDPEGEVLSYAWSISSKPVESRASPSPDLRAETVVELDAVGRYEVALTVRDSLQLAATSKVVLNAVPRDDIAVQLAWQDATGADLDLHLLADEGPETPSHARLFCRQDCFFFNPAPNWFLQAEVGDDPRLLRDDQGTAGQLESTSLVAAPAGSRYRVVVHEYNRGSGPAQVTPKVTVRLEGREFGPFSPVVPLSGTDDAWVAAEIVFPADGSTPSVTASQLHLEPTDDPNPTPAQYTRFQSTLGACE
jgi:hypothetical protein